MDVNWLILLVSVLARIADIALCHEEPKNLTAYVHHQVKMDEGSAAGNFSCDRARGSYYADISTGCKRYHYCTRQEDGSWLHRRMTCPPGTMFDAERNACGWRKVPCGHEDRAKMKPEVADHVTPAADVEGGPRPDLEKDASHLSHTVKNISNHTNERKNATKNRINRNKTSEKEALNRKICPSSLRHFPDLSSGCRKYYSCLRVGRFTVLKYVFQCPHQKRFDPVKMLCVEASKASPCLFPSRTDYKNSTVSAKEWFNLSSPSNGSDYGFHELLSSNDTVQSLDHVMARRIMSYVDSGRNLSDTELKSVSTLLSGTQNMPLTVLAASRLLSTGVRRLTNGTDVLGRVRAIYEDYENRFGPAFSERSRLVVRNLTSLVERSGAVDALRRAAPYKGLWSAYDSFQRSWLNMTSRTVRLIEQEEVTTPSAERVSSLSTTYAATENYSSTTPPPPNQDIINHVKKSDLSVKHNARNSEVPGSALKSLERPDDIQKQSQRLSFRPLHTKRQQNTGHGGLPLINNQDKVIEIPGMPITAGKPVAIPTSRHKESDMLHALPFGGLHRTGRRPILIVDQVDVFHGPETSHFIPDQHSQLASPVWRYK